MKILKKLLERKVKPCIHWEKLRLKETELTLIFLLGLCFFHLNAQSKIEAGSILFSHKHMMSENEEKQINQWQDTLSRIASQQKGIPYNSEDYAGFSIAQFLKNTPETIITIDFSPDTIWKYEMENDRIIGDFLRIEHGSGVVYYHAKLDKSFVYRQVNLFDVPADYVVEVDTNSRKTILGFDCHKVVLQKKREAEELDLPIALNFGDEVFEMYVTDKIALPAHALIFFNQPFVDFFPLEIKSYGTEFPGLYEIFEAKELKIKK